MIIAIIFLFSGIRFICSPYLAIKSALSSLRPGRIKTVAAHFPVQCDERTGMQQATLGKSGSDAASQSQARMARAFSSGSLVNIMEMTAAIQYILTTAQSLASQDYYKKSRMTILGLTCILFCENEQA